MARKTCKIEPVDDVIAVLMEVTGKRWPGKEPVAAKDLQVWHVDPATGVQVINTAGCKRLVFDMVQYIDKFSDVRIYN